MYILNIYTHTYIIFIYPVLLCLGLVIATFSVTFFAMRLHLPYVREEGGMENADIWRCKMPI